MPGSRGDRAGRVRAPAIALLGFSSLLLIVVVVGMLGLVACTSDPGHRTWRMEQRAETLAAAGDLAAADRLMVTVRERDPDKPGYLIAHARIKSRRGHAAAALDLLERAAALGLADETEVADDAAFDELRADPRYVSVVAAVRANRAAFRQQLRAAERPVDASSAREFADLASLEKAREEAESARHDDATIEAYLLRRARSSEEWAAALARLADAKRGTPDEEGARYALLDHRMDEAFGVDLTCRATEAEKVRDAAGAYLAALPKGEHAAAARIALAAVAGASLLPDDFEYDTDPVPAPRCAEALPALADLAADGTANRWSTLATGLHALCLFEVDPTRAAEIRAGLDAYDAGPQPEWKDASALDWLAPRMVKVTRWRLDGPPPLAGTTVDGRRVSLADFRGKVTLLDFWSPG